MLCTWYGLREDLLIRIFLAMYVPHDTLFVPDKQPNPYIIYLVSLDTMAIAAAAVSRATLI